MYSILDDIASIDDSVFNQVLSISAKALGRLQRNPDATELEVSALSGSNCRKALTCCSQSIG
jgi:hypothetical protein